tara:strand:+ start:349 stop:714 length:366 start_codon:yes stop_codon:yes gene_type:complete
MKKPKWSYEIETRSVLKALRKLGYSLGRVDYENGWGEVEGVEKVTLKPSEVKKATEAIGAVDASHLYARTPKGQEIYVYLIAGNSPGELVADWLMPKDPQERGDLDEALTSVSKKYYGQAR